MAHVGKFYKLQFRRDLAAVFNNNGAYPEAYMIGGIAGFGPIGSRMPTDPWQVINLLKDNQPPMIWVSDDQIVNGLPVHVRIDIIDSWHLGQSDIVLRVFKNVADLIYQQTMRCNPLSGPQPGLWFTVSATVDVETPEYNSHGLGFSVSGHAATWTEYNP